MRGMTIGQLATAAGVGVETIRYYQRRGLIDVPGRPIGSARRYPEAIVAQLAFIRRAQEMGFTLDEISMLLKLRENDCGVAQGYARAKYDELGERIEALVRMRERLQQVLERCGATPGGAPCPFISVLNGAGD